ncbi:hypothetical protein L3X38_022896 [Prunus dulcis]|uniref:Ankyrin repeat family protein n=1 Tax=Prunus dulcis TaxID=3755 RepID=A0AAD4Z3Z8_PRUDU|nr:hypothetical protein L3X38_022896 [Prunus dulcis]
MFWRLFDTSTLNLWNRLGYSVSVPFFQQQIRRDFEKPEAPVNNTSATSAKITNTRETPQLYSDREMERCDTTLLVATLIATATFAAGFMAVQDNKGKGSPTETLHVAAYVGRATVLEVMIRYRPDACDLLNAKGQTILHAAVLGGQINVVEFILQTNKLDGLINEAGKDGNTPLHLAAAYPHLEIVEGCRQ